MNGLLTHTVYMAGMLALAPGSSCEWANSPRHRLHSRQKLERLHPCKRRPRSILVPVSPPSVKHHSTSHSLGPRLPGPIASGHFDFLVNAYDYSSFTIASFVHHNLTISPLSLSFPPLSPPPLSPSITTARSCRPYHFPSLQFLHCSELCPDQKPFSARRPLLISKPVHWATLSVLAGSGPAPEPSPIVTISTSTTVLKSNPRGRIQPFASTEGWHLRSRTAGNRPNPDSGRVPDRHFAFNLAFSTRSPITCQLLAIPITAARPPVSTFRPSAFYFSCGHQTILSAPGVGDFAFLSRD
ncbi:hypothetical protein QC761_0100910 [Podospora bellae-mahoneyi]|uniref:Uncharacterized protein n=1 Tax=Podospora bellae-mahoneyi TaxID=2093777 RepID=A0ABR0F6R0_9PEZI|nr:hypothetical protein QC761_0100910 [Podospora bellae-mahoneyi]